MLWKATVSKRLYKCCIVILTWFNYASCNSSFAVEEYSFGIVPQQAASTLAKTWAPVVDYLQALTGYKLRFKTAKSIPAFEENLATGKYDFAYMNPYHYVMFHNHAGYQAFAKAKDKMIKGIIVVHKNSQIKSIYDLNNRVVAFPSPMAFAASMLTQAELRRQRINITPTYVASHDSVYRNVADKNFVAGGGVLRTYEAIADEVRGNIRILHTTKGYTPHAVAAHPKIPAKVVRQVLQAMQSMDQSETGREMLDRLKIKGFGRARDSDWDDVRKIRF